MRFSINKTDLQEYTTNLYNVVPSKNTMPILTNYLIESFEDRNIIKLTATDLELTVIVEFEANVIESGKAVVNAKIFNDLIHSLPDTIIFFAIEDEYLRVKYENSKFDLMIADSSQYPIIPEKDMENALPVDALLFKKMIKNTSFSVLTDGNRAAYNGIYWKITPELQVMAATDGTKIAEFKILKENNTSSEFEQIVPLKGVQFIDKIINANIPTINALIEPNRVMFAYGNYTIFVNSLEGPYPDYTAAYPKEKQPNVLIIEKKSLQTVIKRISLMASEDYQRIKFDLTEDSSLTISAVNRELGEAKEVIKDVNYTGNDLSINMNYRHLLAILSVIETEETMIRFGSSSSPIMIYNSEDNEDYSAKFLLMPLRRR